ncbi:hypothetical protein [Ornithinimicrobium kibberense]|uniref:hypothetical protein n=1 Tax=Ornithinimicrobium kibberense TaxID=282060 RepID=UPI003616F738
MQHRRGEGDRPQPGRQAHLHGRDRHLRVEPVGRHPGTVGQDGADDLEAGAQGGAGEHVRPGHGVGPVGRRGGEREEAAEPVQGADEPGGGSRRGGRGHSRWASTARAAAKRAIGTRKGEHDT